MSNFSNYLYNKYDMRITICITNYNQNKSVKQTINMLEQQYQRSEYVFICSNGKPFRTTDPNIICIDSKTDNKYESMNSVIQEFLDSDSDAIIFIDGDSCPMEKDFIIKYEDLFENYDLIFGNDTDIKSWQNSKKFNEKLDLIITGKVSCANNFGFTRKGLLKHIAFMKKTYGKKEIFDICGYEDIDIGINALYAGLDITVSNNIKLNEKPEDAADAIKNFHSIMEKIRNLDYTTTVKDKTYKTLMILFGIYIIGVMTGLVTMAMTLGGI